MATPFATMPNAGTNAARVIESTGRAIGVGSVKFTEQVSPSAKLISYIIDIKRVFKRGITLGIADGVMKVDGQIAYAADGLKVALFTGDEAAAES